MALTFTTTSKASQVNGVKMLVHSVGGIGKTMLNATLPNPFIVSIEKGLLSLSKENITKTFGANRSDVCYDIPTGEITGFADMTDVFRFLTESEHARHFESIGLDSISDIAEVCLSGAKKLVKDGRLAYGELNEKMGGMIRSFRDLPGKHVYFTAKQDKELDPGSNLMLYAPSMPGKELTRQLPYFFDEVFSLNVSPKDPTSGKSFRFLRTQPDPQYYAKDRSGFLEEIEEPHLGKIINKIKQVK